METLTINGTDVALSENLNAAITYAIEDLSDPSKRKTDHSKTIRLAGTKALNTLLDQAFEINGFLDTAVFNPKRKADVVYTVDGSIQLDGYMKLV